MSPVSSKTSGKKAVPKKIANFTTVRELDVPHSRNGKHHKIVVQILADLEELEPGMAIQVPLAHLADSKENVRSALNRALSKKKIVAATASDTTHFYIWKK
jgi:hypothetical protein